MKNLPIAIKTLINILFFLIYLLITVVIGDIIFCFILSIIGKPVPSNIDPIHMKLALIVGVITLLFTIIFRKFFYIKLVVFENEKNNDFSEKNINS